jgi:heme exporter protein B
MKAFWALVYRDIRLSTRVGGEAMTLILFFIMVGVIVPIAIGPDSKVLSRLAPGLIWIAAFLAMILGLDRLFRADDEDGSLLLMRHSRLPFPAVVAAKMVAHWVLTALPLILATPIMALLLAMDFAAWRDSVISLLAGTPGLVAFGAMGAAVTVSLRRGGLIAPVLILPLSIPVLIFGTSAIGESAGRSSAALLFLCAVSLMAAVLAPFAAALALRLSED